MKQWLALILIILFGVRSQEALARKFTKPFFKPSIDKGFAALNEFDYFKAKKIFYTCHLKYRKAADFGLATIVPERQSFSPN